MMPKWARYQGLTWADTGHRLLFPVSDAEGEVRSIRALRIIDGDTPKRLTPVGASVKGLVLACSQAISMLETGNDGNSHQIIIAEGEPDFLTWATRFSDADENPPSVIGVVSGSWSSKLAASIPSDSKVIIRTHNDPSGDKYAQEINETLWRNCTIYRVNRESQDAKQR